MTLFRERVPAFLRPVFKAGFQVVNHALDLVDLVTGRRDPLVPPRAISFIGTGDFKKIGNEFREYFVELGELKPSDRVLDVGSGLGRMAVPLTTYLTSGSYQGIEIVREGVEWCTAHITSRYPSFVFTHSNIFNAKYNPRGDTSASDYRFPFPDDEFDFVFLTSVFTHMRAAEVRNYLREIERVLKPGGRCLATFFLLNDESRSLMESGKSSVRFTVALDECFTTGKEMPERGIAYTEEWVRDAITASGLKIRDVRYGSWPGRRDFTSYQDLVIFENV